MRPPGHGLPWTGTGAPPGRRQGDPGNVGPVKSFVRVVQDLALIVVRLAVALVLFLHGWHRFVTVGMSTEIARLTGHGLPYPAVLGWSAVTFEMIGAVLLAFGLLTPLIGLGMVVENVAIIAWLKAPHGYLVSTGGYEYNLVLAAVGLIFLAFGGGRGAVDTLLRRRPHAQDAPVIQGSATG